MGHLINPRAFRLGINNSWEDVWYIKNLYYSEYLHNVLNIRNFIYYFFTRKKFLKSGVCFSHLNLFKFNKQHIIKIFIYHIDMEKSSYKFLNKIYRGYYNSFKDKRKNGIKFSKNFFLTHNSDLFLFIFIYFHLFLKNFKRRSKRKFRSKYFISSIKYEHSNNLLSFFNDKIFKFITNFIDKKKKSFKNFNLLLKKNNKLDFKHLLNQQIYNKMDLDADYIINNNLVFNYFFNYFLYICKKVDLKKYQNSWDLYSKWYSVLNILKLFKYMKFIDKCNYKYNKFFFYLSSILYINEILKKLKYKNKLRDLIYFYIYNWLGQIYFFPYFKILSILWKKLFFNLFNFDNLKFYYYFLSNRDITASFLSRYIGLKLRKNHYLFAIINPLRKELWNIAKKARLKARNKINRFKHILYKFKEKFKLNLYNIHNIFKSVNFIYYKNNLTLVFISIFELKYFLKNNMRLNSLYYFISLNKYLLLNIYYIIYFEMNKNKWDFNISKILSMNINFINILLNIFNIFNNILYINNKIYKIYNTNLLYMSTMFSKFYIYYNYIKVIWLQNYSINKRNIRRRLFNAYNYSIVGYKMGFYGRFSRKQKASSIWFTHGRVPLNTLNIHIDYSFFTIPLKNSAVSIKIWLYKNIMYNNYKHILKY